jgi:hypothetical protein
VIKKAMACGWRLVFGRGGFPIRRDRQLLLAGWCACVRGVRQKAKKVKSAGVVRNLKKKGGAFSRVFFAVFKNRRSPKNSRISVDARVAYDVGKWDEK